MPYANICVCFVFPVSCQDASSTRIAKRASSVGVGKLAKRRISKRPAACAETERADLHKEIHPVWKKGPQNWTAWNWNYVQIHELVLIVQEPHSMTMGVRVGLNVLDSTVVVKVYVRSLFIRESFYCPQEMVCFARGTYFEELDSVDVGWGAWVCCELKPRPQLPPGKKPRCTKGQRSLVNP